MKSMRELVPLTSTVPGLLLEQRNPSPPGCLQSSTSRYVRVQQLNQTTSFPPTYPLPPTQVLDFLQEEKRRCAEVFGPSSPLVLAQLVKETFTYVPEEEEEEEEEDPPTHPPTHS